MLHIILLILKIIGWILLAILGLIVLLLCVVFFVPLCYRADGSCKGTFDSLYGKIRFSWLWHLVSGIAVYEEGKLSWTVRIAWKKMSSEEPVQESVLDELEVPGENMRQGEPAQEEIKQEPGREKEPDKEKEPGEFESDAKRLEKLMQEEVKQIPFPEPEEKEEEKGPGLFSRIGNLFRGFTEKVKKLYEKLKYTFLKICDTMKTTSDKKDKLILFITDEVHKSALGAVLVEVRRLLRFLKPKKLKADVHFGFEDPYYTGQVLAVLSVIYPFLGDHVDIEPDFEQKVLEGSIMISGKVRVLYMIIMLWNLVWNKNVRTTIKHIRKFEL
ncbi:DUF2953 domain-containing protein [Faecalicatena orotica]|uniref:DUF2953 domain-containing protein n=1 Tax=Faecalicatena orotica TaxID=1544 RepID=UPI000D6C7A0E|nr:DUF2953 domain-containing protein [Faecalicatena orotica]